RDRREVPHVGAGEQGDLVLEAELLEARVDVHRCRTIRETRCDARCDMAPWPFITLAGAGIGLLMGFFGVGGSSVATPLLSLLGVSGFASVASPLPATIPSALVGAVPYLRRGEARPRAAGWSLLGAVPA